MGEQTPPPDLSAGDFMRTTRAVGMPDDVTRSRFAPLLALAAILGSWALVLGLFLLVVCR